MCLVDRVSGGAFAGLSNPETGEAACAETDSAGRFAGHIFTDGDHGNPVDLWLNISAAGGAGAVVDGNGSTYAVLVDASDDLDEPLTRLGDTTMGGADGIRRAFWILDAASLGREAVRNATGHSVPPLDIAWLNDTRSRERTSYDPENMSMTLSSAVRRGTAHGAEAYPASILHEYGHHVLRTAYPDAAPAGSGGAACAAPIGRTAGPSCAWSEGWAHFFPAHVLGDPTIQYHGQRHPADLEAARWNVRSPSLSSAFAPGSAGQVASALWDLHDPAGEPGDTVANKTAAIWEALRLTKAADGPGSAAGPSFAEFAAAWNGARSNPSLAGVMVLNGLASMRSLLAGAAAAPSFSDSFESGAGSWVVSGTGNWVAVPGAGHNGSAALYSSGCAPPRGCEATALASLNASEYMRAAFRILLEGGSQSVLTLQRSADGLSWSDAASYNGSISSWREAAVDAMPAGAGSANHFRLVAVSPSPPNRSAVVDDALIRADAPPTVCSSLRRPRRPPQPHPGPRRVLRGSQRRCSLPVALRGRPRRKRVGLPIRPRQRHGGARRAGGAGRRRQPRGHRDRVGARPVRLRAGPHPRRRRRAAVHIGGHRLQDRRGVPPRRHARPPGARARRRQPRPLPLACAQQVLGRRVPPGDDDHTVHRDGLVGQHGERDAAHYGGRHDPSLHRGDTLRCHGAPAALAVAARCSGLSSPDGKGPGLGYSRAVRAAARPLVPPRHDRRRVRC